MKEFTFYVKRKKKFEYHVYITRNQINFQNINIKGINGDHLINV